MVLVIERLASGISLFNLCPIFSITCIFNHTQNACEFQVKVGMVRISQSTLQRSTDVSLLLCHQITIGCEIRAMLKYTQVVKADPSVCISVCVQTKITIYDNYVGHDLGGPSLTTSQRTYSETVLTEQWLILKVVERFHYLNILPPYPSLHTHVVISNSLHVQFDRKIPKLYSITCTKKHVNATKSDCELHCFQLIVTSTVLHVHTVCIECCLLFGQPSQHQIIILQEINHVYIVVFQLYRKNSFPMENMQTSVMESHK